MKYQDGLVECPSCATADYVERRGDGYYCASCDRLFGFDADDEVTDGELPSLTAQIMASAERTPQERRPQITNAARLSPLRTPTDHAERHRPHCTDAELEELRRGAQGI